MKNEKEFKSLFKKSVKRAHGFSLSLAAPMIVGIPDLYVVLPGYMPVLLEAKWLGEIKREIFNRRIPFTEMQMLWIKACHEVNPFSAMGLIGFIYKDKLHACLVAHGTPMFYKFSNCFLIDCAYVTCAAETKVFDVQQLFSKVPIPRIEQPRKKDIITEHDQTKALYDSLADTTGLAVLPL